MLLVFYFTRRDFFTRQRHVTRHVFTRQKNTRQNNFTRQKLKEKITCHLKIAHPFYVDRNGRRHELHFAKTVQMCWFMLTVKPW